MSSKAMRFLTLYALLVAIPVTSVFLVLHFGRHVSALSPVKGSWTLHLEGDLGRGLRCELPRDSSAGGDDEPARLEVTQSGRQIGLVMISPESGAASSLRGELRQNALRARGRASLHRDRARGDGDDGDTVEHASAAEHPIRLSARVEGTEAARMVGRVEFPACPQAGPLLFVATRTTGSSPS